MSCFGCKCLCISGVRFVRDALCLHPAVQLKMYFDGVKHLRHLRGCPHKVAREGDQEAPTPFVSAADWPAWLASQNEETPRSRADFEAAARRTQHQPKPRPLGPSPNQLSLL